MTTTFYRNQYADGGAVTAEKWQLFDASTIERTYGSCYSLEQKAVELPDGYTVAESKCGTLMIYDSDGEPCELVYNAITDRMDAVSMNGIKRIW